MPKSPEIRTEKIGLQTLLAQSVWKTRTRKLREMATNRNFLAFEQYGNDAHKLATFCVMEVRGKINKRLRAEVKKRYSVPADLKGAAQKEARNTWRNKKMIDVLGELIPMEKQLKYLMSQPIIEPRNDSDHTELDRVMELQSANLKIWAEETQDVETRNNLFRLSVDEDSPEREVLHSIAEARLLTREALESMVHTTDFIDWRPVDYSKRTVQRKHKNVPHNKLWPYRFEHSMGQITQA